MSGIPTATDGDNRFASRPLSRREMVLPRTVQTNGVVVRGFPGCQSRRSFMLQCGRPFFIMRECICITARSRFRVLGSGSAVIQEGMPSATSHCLESISLTNRTGENSSRFLRFSTGSQRVLSPNLDPASRNSPGFVQKQDHGQIKFGSERIPVVLDLATGISGAVWAFVSSASIFSARSVQSNSGGRGGASNRKNSGFAIN